MTRPGRAAPRPLATLAGLLPSGALADGLRTALAGGASPGPQPLLVLTAWAVVAGLLATRLVRLR